MTTRQQATQYTDTPQTPLGLEPTARALAPSATLAMNEAIATRRAAGREVIHLGFGEASFPLHPLLREALARAATQTSYAPVLGIPALREAIAGYLTRTRGLQIAAEQVIVGPGSKPLLFALLQVLHGDLLLPSPSWVSYAPQAALAGKRVIPVEVDPADRHRLTPEALNAALHAPPQPARTPAVHAPSQAPAEIPALQAPRLLLVNTPNNPTGSMFAAEDAEAVALWVREQGITLLSDEIYAELVHGWRAHASPARFYPEGTIVTGGLSKAFSAGGWRLGYAALPAGEAGRRVMSAVQAIASEVWSSAATPVQAAAVLAFSPNAEVETYVRRSAQLHGYITGRLYATLADLGVPCPRPAGGFYLYPDFAPWRGTLAARGVRTSADLARLLLEEWDIAALPGVDFCEGPEVLRLRMATSMLCLPLGATTPEQREVALWRLLEATEALPDTDPAAGAPLPLPALELAQERLAAFVHSLGSQEITHA